MCNKDATSALPYCCRMYSSDEREVLLIVTSVTAGLSLLGCLFILLVYLLFKELRVFAFKLVVHMTIGDFLRSLGFLLQFPYLCPVQAMLIQAGSLASVLWNGVIARTLYLSVVLELRDMEEMEARYTYGVYGVVAVLTALPWTTMDYGDAEGWCWINTSGSNYTSGSVWRVVCFFLPLLLVILNNLFSYISVIRALRKNFHNTSGDIPAFIQKLRFYPIILIVCYACTASKRIYDIAAPDGDDFAWAVLVAVVLGSVGLVDAIVYGFTPSVRQAIVQKLCPRRDRSDSMSSLSDVSLM